MHLFVFFSSYQTSRLHVLVEWPFWARAYTTPHEPYSVHSYRCCAAARETAVGTSGVQRPGEHLNGMIVQPFSNSLGDAYYFGVRRNLASKVIISIVDITF